jgi:hypothetical protein
MEPHLVTLPQLLAVEEQLKRREPLFHREEFGTTRPDFEKMTAPEFWEVGASGRRYSREYVLGILESRLETAGDDPWEVRDFHCAQIAPDNFLATYTLLQGQRMTRRATIWRRSGAAWQAVYHQGTLVDGAQ